MEKQVIVFDIPISKKHSVRYDTTEEDPAIESIYVKRSHLGTNPARKLRITIEEVNE